MKKDHKLAPSKKYTVTREPKNSTKVILLLKDDLKPYLTPVQRTALMEEVGKQYTSAKKKQENDAKPKITLSVAQARIAEGNLGWDEMLKGIKEGWVLVE